MPAQKSFIDQVSSSLSKLLMGRLIDNGKMDLDPEFSLPYPGRVGDI